MSETQLGNVLLIEGTGVNDNDILFTSSDVSLYTGFMLMSSAGAVDIEVSLNGTDFSTAPLSLQDLGAVTSSPVIVTAAGRMYGFVGSFLSVRARQNGATAATAAMIACRL